MRLLDAINRFYYDVSLNELRMMNDNTLYPNITYNSLLYLDLIYYKEDCTVSYLADVLRISKSAVTIKVNELIRQGLVRKIQSESDRRVFFLSVTPAVKTEYSGYNRRLNHAVELLMERFSTEQLETFCDMLDLIRDSYLEEPG